MEMIAAALPGAAVGSVEGEYVGEELWNRFATKYGRQEHHRRLWFLQEPFHVGGASWLLANNVWGTKTAHTLQALADLAPGKVLILGPDSEAIGSLGDPTAQATPPWDSASLAKLAELAAHSPRWLDVQRSGPRYGFGEDTVRIAAQLLAHGLHVEPDTEGVAPLIAVHGTRTYLVSTQDYDGGSQPVGARISTRLGPFREGAAFDRALADFNVHGPFERHVERRDGSAHVTVSVRLQDVDTALLDLANVCSLEGILSEASR